MKVATPGVNSSFIAHPSSMPLILTAALPGLGHWKAGQRGVGAVCIALSLLMIGMVLIDSMLLISMAFAFIGDPEAGFPEGVLPLAASVMIATVYGLLYTGLLLWDIKRNGECAGRALSGALVFALISASAVTILVAALNWSALRA